MVYLLEKRGHLQIYYFPYCTNVALIFIIQNLLIGPVLDTVERLSCPHLCVYRPDMLPDD